jgi:hypothetical protein
MKVEQISVFLENKSGRIAEVTGILAESGINIRALSLADTSDFGVLRMIVDNNQKAEDTLKKHNFTVGKTFVVAVEVEDKPGGLYKILSILHKVNINVEYMYAFVQPNSKNAVMIFRFEKLEEAVRVLQENGVVVIDGDMVYTL